MYEAMGALIGLGLLVFFSAFGYWMYHMGRNLKSEADVNERYGLFEIAALNKKAKDKGINLDKEREKMRTLNYLPKKKTFRKMLHKEIVEEFFEHETTHDDNRSEDSKE